ncbi:MAG: hypothetical protein QNJ84_02155 [Alphaproteobacteria bacterium]|nr:hypothetical protein [Alphaproteobacteria bacterium]
MADHENMDRFNDRAEGRLSAYLTGRYVDKAEALEILAGMNVRWTRRQIDWTAEPDASGARRWPWFLDDKGILRIDEGFIHRQFEAKQLAALSAWKAGIRRD